MGTVMMRLRADLRTRWRAMLGLALLLGLVGGVALTAAAGARRTDSAYSRLLSWANASRVTVIVTNSESVAAPGGQLKPKDKYFVAGGRAAEQVRRRYFAALGAPCPAWPDWRGFRAACHVPGPDGGSTRPRTPRNGQHAHHVHQGHHRPRDRP